VVPVHADDPERGQQRKQFAKGAHVPKPLRGPQAHERRLALGFEEVDLGGVDRPPSIPSEVQEQAFRCGAHGPFLPRTVGEGKRTVVPGR
jgi:hypothetical protein